ncbi:MAG: hypothetical protein QF526_00275 [Alphaproteobacteria bacterium]|nr:hypothetical protein [Alphaproteobacteria bacterium]
MKPLFNSQMTVRTRLSKAGMAAFCAASFLLPAMVHPAAAQGREDAPVNLLQLGQTAPKTDDSSADSTPAPDSPDASDKTLGSDTVNAGEIFVLPDVQLEEASPAALTDTQNAAAEEQTEPPANDGTPALVRTRSDLPATSLARRSVSRVSLASVGLKRAATLSEDLNALIWSDSDAETALYLLRNVPAMGSAPILSQLTFEIMASAAVPPKGAGSVAEELVSTRLNWLAAAGQSDALAEIVRMLPEEDRWAEWKRWQVEYDLIRQADDTACRDAEKKAQLTLDDFWHQSRIICALLAGDKNNARFAADILKASGGEDVNFFQLVDKLLGSEAEISLDLATLDSVDLVLMDAAHEQISLAAFEQMPSSMIQAASNFRYLAADAALKTSFMMLERGLQKRGPTEQIWRSLLEAPMPAEAALATLDGQDAFGQTAARHDALVSASLWVGLALRKEADTNILIRRAFETEIRSGRPELLLDLYASLIQQRLSQTADSETAPAIDAELQKDFALMLSLSAPSDELPAALSAGSELGKSAKNVLAAAKGQSWQAEDLEIANAWPLLPVLEAQGSVGPQQDWTAMLTNTAPDLFTPRPVKPAYHRLSATHLLALRQLAEKGNIAETALLSAMLVQPVALGWIEPVDAAEIIKSLQQVGLQSVADQLAEDIVKAHLLRANFALAS